MIWHNTIQFNLDKTRSDNEHMYISLFLYLYTLLLLNTSNLYFRTPRCSIFGLLHPPKEGQNSILWKTTAISGFQVQPPFPIPICSMYALVTYVEQPLYCKCRQIFHTWIIWDINGLELWKKKRLSRISPTGLPLNRPRKKPEYLIARSQLTERGPLVRSHSVFAGIYKSHRIHVWYIYPHLP